MKNIIKYVSQVWFSARYEYNNKVSDIIFVYQNAHCGSNIDVLYLVLTPDIILWLNV